MMGLINTISVIFAIFAAGLILYAIGNLYPLKEWPKRILSFAFGCLWLAAIFGCGWLFTNGMSILFFGKSIWR